MMVIPIRKNQKNQDLYFIASKYVDDNKKYNIVMRVQKISDGEQNPFKDLNPNNVSIYHDTKNKQEK